MIDQHTTAMMTQTAGGLARIAALRGIARFEIEVRNDGRYIVNGTDCGSSIHGVNEWMNRQPGVKP